MAVATDIRVLVVEDYPVVLYGLSHYLKSQDGISVVGAVATGRESVELTRVHSPDVVVTCLDLPDMSGVDAISRIRAENPNIRCVVLTSYDGDDDIHRALEAGADAYLTKKMPVKDLTDAIFKVHAGGHVLPPPIAENLAAWTPNSDLSPREREVLALVVEGKNNKSIGAQLQITEGTVKGYVNGILRRLSASSRSEAAAMALRRGIVHL